MRARKNNLKNFCAIVSSPFGAIGIRTAHDHVCQLVYLPPHTPTQLPRSPLTATVTEQLQHYFADPSYQFSLPLEKTGSLFRNKVWQAISAIPLGHTQTYGTLAQQIGSAPRAVGQACGDNPFPLIIPCHRVVAKNGLGGFAHTHTAGYQQDAKRWLLTHESALAA
ncbi:MAG: methylated-DNA--[protein]-cysteine S-methyltransferase [Ottowia sp.]|nr:methylated-DNA--[protein]-cysteine S-methyltransferase [Ottowia sp.]